MPDTLKTQQIDSALRTAVGAARGAGTLMQRELRRPKKVHEITQHDIKLELDVRCQRLIERGLLAGLPGAAILGEEGVLGDPGHDLRWVVDPIDGTVNFAYGIPHACVSIALQRRGADAEAALDRTGSGACYEDGYETVAGVVLDPFTNDLWTATAHGPARLNGRVIRTSARARLNESIVALGFAKKRRTLDLMLPVFQSLVHRVRKIRIMGAAALSMTYVACSRFDAYVESGVRLWDIAAGGLIVQRAGGVFYRREVDRDRTYEILVCGTALQRPLQRLVKASR